MALAEIQSSLNAGELSPNLYARTDLAKFESGAALLRNFFVDYRGGAANRGGTKFIAACKSAAGVKRLIPFIVATSAAYILEFGEHYIRAYLSENLVDEVVTPYAAVDLALLKFTQSADVLTLVHPTYPPANLSRTDDVTFSYDLIQIGPDVQPPTITTMVAPHSGPYSYGYLVTAVDVNGKEESLPSNPGVKHSEGQNELTNRVVGLSWDPPAQGVSAYNVYKWGPIDAVTLNPATVWGFIGTSQTTTFTDNNIAPDFSKQPPGWGDPFSGGQFQSISVLTGGSGYDGVSGDWPTAIPYVPLVIVGDGTSAAGYAVIDHATGKIIGVYLTNPGKNYTTATITANGQGGTGATFSFTFSALAPVYPGSTAYVQQRRAFAGSIPKPETMVLSQVGLYNNFNTTPVSLATDAIVASIAGEQVNTIKSMVPVSYGLLLFTTSEVVLMNGGSPYAAISPETISFQTQSAVGANDLVPLRVNTDVLYTQNLGNRVRNLSFAWQKQAYQGSDISALAAHLFDGFTIPEWTWAEEPYKLVWAVRDDGKMLSMTYVPDQDVAAWCRHDTQGLFKSVASIPEDNQNAVYVIVERYVPANNPDPSDPSGNWVLYIEKMQSRQGCCIFDAWHLDCALALDNPAGQGTLYIAPGAGNTVTLTAGDGIFVAGDITGTGSAPVINGVQQYLGNHDPSGNHQKFSTNWDTFTLYVRNTTNIDVFNIQTAAAIATGVTDTFGFDNGLLYGEGWLYGWSGATINQVTPGTLTLNQSVVGVSQPADWLILPLAGGIDYLVTIGWADNRVTYYNTGPGNLTNSGVNHTTTLGRGVMCNGNRAGVRKGTGQIWVMDTPIGGTPVLSTNIYSFLLASTSNTFTQTHTLLATAVSPTWTHISVVQFVFLDETDLNIIAGVAESTLTPYSAATTYIIGNIVSSAGHDYISRVNANINNDPATHPVQWTDLGVSGPSQSRLIKINVLTGAVMWSINVGALPSADLGPMGRYGSNRVRYGKFCYIEPLNQSFHNSNILHDINTLTGVDVTTVIAGVYPDIQFYNDYYGQLVLTCGYDDTTPSAPQPLNGSAGSWGLRWATLGSFPAAPPPTIIGQVVQVGCGKVLVTAQPTPSTATATILAPLEGLIEDDPNGLFAPIATDDWTVTTPVSVLTGLDHLEGKIVWALADGEVVEPLTVTGGSVTLPSPASNIVVGLQYTQQIKTLYLTMDDLQPGSIQGKRKLIPAVTLRVDCTKGLLIGQDFDNLTAVPDLNSPSLPAGTLFLGDARTVIGAAWDEKGEICIQQNNPLPASVLGIIVEVVPGDTGR